MNSDYTTDDVSYQTTDTLYMRIFSIDSDVDPAQMKKFEFELKKTGTKDKVKGSLTNLGDGNYEGSFVLADFKNGVSSGDELLLTMKLEDFGKDKFEVKNISISII